MPMTTTGPKSKGSGKNAKPEGMTAAMRKAFEESYERNEEALRRLAKL